MQIQKEVIKKWLNNLNDEDLNFIFDTVKEIYKERVIKKLPDMPDPPMISKSKLKMIMRYRDEYPQYSMIEAKLKIEKWLEEQNEPPAA